MIIFKVQHAYVIIKIIEVMSNLIFSEFYCMFSFQFSMTPVQIHSSHSSFLSSSHPSSIYLSSSHPLFILPFISSSYSSHCSSLQFTSSSHLSLSKFFSISSSHSSSLSSSHPTSLSLSHFSSLNHLFISLIFHLTYHHTLH